MKREGKSPVVRSASPQEYENFLREKLLEEVNEFLESGAQEELADIMEVVFALGEMKGVDERALRNIREEKRRERGGFSKRILLEKFEEEHS